MQKPFVISGRSRLREEGRRHPGRGDLPQQAARRQSHEVLRRQREVRSLGGGGRELMAKKSLGIDVECTERKESDVINGYFWCAMHLAF